MACVLIIGKVFYLLIKEFSANSGWLTVFSGSARWCGGLLSWSGDSIAWLLLNSLSSLIVGPGARICMGIGENALKIS